MSCKSFAGTHLLFANQVKREGTIALQKTTAGTAASAGIRIAELWVAAAAAALIPASLLWDFSWESSIGVDRFWSPPHLATHIGVWMNGALALWLIARFTMDHRRSGSRAGIGIAGWRGPAGAWVLLWGAVLMLAAFLLDSWWQQAYGLGAGLWHPGQILKAVGFFTLLSGGAMLGAANGSDYSEDSTCARLLRTWHAGMLLLMCAVVLTAQNYPNWQHAGSFCLISAAVYPFFLSAAGGFAPLEHGAPSIRPASLVAPHALPSRCPALQWPATSAALVYTLAAGAAVWLLPLFPARPLTAPIHNPTDHLMPPPFPLLLIAPALVMDAARISFGNPKKIRDSSPRLLPDRRLLNGWPVPGSEFGAAGFSGLIFVGVFIPVQWWFAGFLLSPLAANRFFSGGGQHWPFYLKIDRARVMFWGLKQDPLTPEKIVLAILLASGSAWLGMRAARALHRLRQ